LNILYFLFFLILVEAASLCYSSFLKPNPYIELSVDHKNPRKTEVSKSTLQPKWNEEFTVLVTPHSYLHFRLLNHSSFRKDTLIGETSICIYHILLHYNGKLENLELTLDLLSGNKFTYVQPKTADLTTLFDRLRIDMNTVAPPFFLQTINNTFANTSQISASPSFHPGTPSHG
jgi:atrophin-1 interacting protein 5 (WW domain-containing E3 ubiquitin protein ligase 1)